MRKSFPNDIDIVNMYTIRKMPSTKISEFYEISKGYVLKVLKRNNVFMRSIRKEDSTKKIIDAYQSGLSENQTAKKFNVSRSVVRRVLTENKIHIRSQSEAEKLKWSKMTDEQRKHQVKAAHETVKTLDEAYWIKNKINAAKTKEVTHSKVGVFEYEFTKVFNANGFTCQGQFAINVYNIDIFIAPDTVVEIHVSTANPHTHKMYVKRIKYLLECGYNVIYIKITKDAFIDIVANKVMRIIEVARINKAFSGKYWMIRGCGELVTVGSFNGNEFSSVLRPNDFFKVIEGN